jgi:hypothetical protein
MRRRLSEGTAWLAAAALAGVVAASGTRLSAPGPAAGVADPFAATSLPWWKRSLAHTVQEEWLFAQQMDTRYGPRWRTALPDKTVARMYQHWMQGRQGGTSR